MRPVEFLQALRAAKATAILRTTSSTAAEPALLAAVRGGFRIVECTLNTPGALKAIEKLASHEGVVVGAGTVLSADDARDAVTAGASFLVSPVVDEAVIASAQALGVAMIPGCATPTEMLRAHRLGAPLQKLFPAPPDGPAWVKATLGPLPFLRIVPTSGVDASNAAEHLRAGAFAVGFVSSLFQPSDVLAGRFDVIEERAKKLLATLRDVESTASSGRG